MVAGPAALAVALMLLPGWVYWRIQPSPRTARTALSELFEVLAAGAVATGVTCLAYVSAEEWLPAKRWPDGLLEPRQLASPDFLEGHIALVSLTLVAIVVIACAGAVLVAKLQGFARATRV